MKNRVIRGFLLAITAISANPATMRAVRVGPDVYILANSTGKPFRLEFSSDMKHWLILGRNPAHLTVKLEPWFRTAYPFAFYRVVDENSDYRPTVVFK